MTRAIKLFMLVVSFQGILVGCAVAQGTRRVALSNSLQSRTSAPDYWPTTAWRSSTPEKQGVDSAQLADAG